MNWDFPFRDETRILDDAARLAADGEFVRLSQGWTHYQSTAAPGAPAVVLVHGFSVPYFIWDPTFKAFSAAGLGVTRYDLYGRGYSDRPRVDHDMRLFLRQLLELIDALQLRQVDLVGLSMGGAIVSAFSLEHAARVRRIVLIDPVGVRPMPLSPLYKIAMVPGISEIVLGLFGTERMLAGLASDFYDRSLVAALQNNFRMQTCFKGFKRAILSSLRHHMLGSFREVYEGLGRSNTRVMLIWGEEDLTVPFSQSQELRELLPRAAFHAIADCGHIPHYEKPGEVNPRLVDFLTAA
jgi:pimeloyl-ACP methyl ester carboxylesterase